MSTTQPPAQSPTTPSSTPTTSSSPSLHKGYGQCSASFMLTKSSANLNGFCANTCGRCNCTSPASSSSPGAATNSPMTVSNAVSSPKAMPSSPEATLASTGAVPSSPVSTVKAVPSSPVSAVKSPAVPTLGPPAPLSAAYLANCDCTDVPPSGTTCPALLAAGQCNTFGTVEGNPAHPEGFCQLTCNHCNNYCVPKNGKSVPAAPTTPSGSSSSSSSGSCSDNPPSKQYSCAQQKSFGKCNQSFMTQGNYCAKTCGRCH
ncbi:TPA: hypothetical protein ACH3X2_006768 [Trebouxia sp. C0005]